MNLGTTVASSLSTSSSLNRPRNTQTGDDHAISSTTISCQNERPKRRRRFQKRLRSSFGSSASSSSSLSKSTIPESESDPGLFLYQVTSQNCPCEHHRSARLRESKSPKNFISEDNENFIDSFIVNNFEASVAPMRGFLTLTSSNGDSGINTNSNGRYVTFLISKALQSSPYANFITAIFFTSKYSRNIWLMCLWAKKILHYCKFYIIATYRKYYSNEIFWPKKQIYQIFG